MSNNSPLYVEKYRPETVDDCILPERLKKVFQSFVDSNGFPNLLLAGPAGTGKTTIAKALASQLKYDLLFINGSNEGRTLDTLRTKVVQFASSVSFSGNRKVVLLDEFDAAPELVQTALRAMIEEFAGNCAFIFTCNFPNRIIDPIHSRCTVVDFTLEKGDKKAIATGLYSRICDILVDEGVVYEKKAVSEVVKKFFPDLRRTLNEIQRYAKTGSVDMGILAESLGNLSIKEVVEFLKDKNFKAMRDWVATTPSLDITTISRSLYDSMYDIVKAESMPELTIILADYSYKNAFAADRELNLAAMFTQIMMDIDFK